MITAEELKEYSYTQLIELRGLLETIISDRDKARDLPTFINNSVKELQKVQGLERAPESEWAPPAPPFGGYTIGETTTWEGKVWRSKIPNNFTVPGDPSDPQNYRWWENLTDVPGTDETTGIAEWDPNGRDYQAGDQLTYQGVTYQVVQGHTSQPGWAPDIVPALYQNASLYYRG